MVRSDYENLRRRFFRVEDSVKNEGTYNSKMYKSIQPNLINNYRNDYVEGDEKIDKYTRNKNLNNIQNLHGQND